MGNFEARVIFLDKFLFEVSIVILFPCYGKMAGLCMTDVP